MMKAVLYLSVVLAVESCVPRYSSEPGCVCGVPGDKRRIVGGEDARSNQYPWQVGLMYTDQDTESFCGGTLLSSDTVLTAGHCVFSIFGAKLPTVYVAFPRGEITLDKAMKIQSSEILLHPYYGYVYFPIANNDFAIIKLSRPVEQFDDSTRPICLPDPTESYEDNAAEVTGWGLVDQPNSIPADNLQTLNVTTMDNKECQDKINNFSQSVGEDITDDIITTNMLCAQHSTDAAKMPCSGDSGGPLITLNKEGSHYSQIGVVSWGDGLCAGPMPGVFGRVTDQLYWIMKQVTGDTCPPPQL